MREAFHEFNVGESSGDENLSTPALPTFTTLPQAPNPLAIVAHQQSHDMPIARRLRDGTARKGGEN